MVLKIHGLPGFSLLSLMLGGHIALPWIGDGGGEGQASKILTWVSSSSSSDETRVVDDGVARHGGWALSQVHWEGVQSS